MSVALIIAEFNPLHAGHAAFLRQVRCSSGASLLVCLMSGNFVQRGTPAVADRWTRAGMTLLAGADVVLELPALYAIQGAAGFARGAVRIAAGLHADTLAFGAESADLEQLMAAARLLLDEPPPIADRIRRARRRGLNHGAARQQALKQTAPALAPLLGSANNTLGIEYLQALLELGSGPQPLVLPRQGAAGRPMSAQAVREELRHATEPREVLQRAGVPLAFSPAFLEDELYRLALYRLRLGGKEELMKTADVTEEVAGRLFGASAAADFELFLSRASTRWLPRARVRRVLLNLVLGFTKEKLASVNSPSAALHTRLLGLRTGCEKAYGALAAASDIPVVSGCGCYPETILAEGDQRAADLYGVLHCPPADPACDKAHHVIRLEGGQLLHL